MTEVYYTSDLHLGHKMVAELRGFSTTEDHDEAILANWAKIVTKRDIVWVLGDLTLKGNPDEQLAKIAKLPGNKHFIAGNHDPCHPMHRDANKYQKRYLTTFESVQAFARRQIMGQPVLLSHFPYTADHRVESRYPQYRLPDLGAFLIHGHTHQADKFSGREMHVGLDAWDLKPIPQYLIANHIKAEMEI